MKKIIVSTLLLLGLVSQAPLSYSDQLVFDDLVIQDSLCVGIFCRRGQLFYHDTIQANTYVTRMFMQDTSSAARFPSADWLFTFNDAHHGGANYFQLSDLDNGVNPIRINGGAPSNSLYIEKNAVHGFTEIGIGTANPQTMLHLTSPNTPSIYFEQTNVGKWPAYAWAMGAHEAYFFWQDITNGNTQPVKIFSNAVANSLSLTNQRRVGIGTSSPSSQLHVVGYGAVARVKNTSTGVSGSWGSNAGELLRLQNATGTYITLSESGLPPTPVVTTWDIGALRGHITFTDLSDNAPGKEFRVFSTGRAVILGTLTTNVNTAMEGASNIDSQLLSNNFMKLPIHKWLSERSEIIEGSEASEGSEGKVTNLSPDPQAFHNLFGLGVGEKYISSSDLDALNVVALKTIDSEYEKQLKALKAQEAKLKKLREAQDKEVAALKGRLKNLKQAQSKYLLVNAGESHHAN